MSLFWRLVFSFLAVALVTFAAQRLLGMSYLGMPPVQGWAVAGSPIARRQALTAVRQWENHGDRAALDELRPFSETGMPAWLVTANRIVGYGSPPPSALAAARRALYDKSQGSLALGYRLVRVADSARPCVLIVVVPGLSSIWTILARAVLLIGAPLTMCYFLARRVSKPIESVSAAASQLAAGFWETRVGQLVAAREIQILGESFDALAQHLEDSVAARVRLLADLSHEIRSPLGRLKMASLMLETGKGDSAKYVRQIQRDVVRLDELVSSLGMIHQNPPTPDVHETCDLGEVAQDVIDSVILEAENRHVILRTHFCCAVVSGDRRKIFGAIENLVRNAIIHSGEGCVINVAISDQPPTVTVTDNGPGIPEHQLQSIFEPFYRLSEARDRDTGGVGLGLAIVKAVAAEHGARVWADSGPDRGLRVTFEFPTPSIHRL